jgi:DNA-directed RNA polymerase subunit RPC12/RpoP
MSTSVAIRYKCEDCGAIFNEGQEEHLELVYDKYNDEWYVKHFYDCPNCESHEYYIYDEETNTD